jgi:hypothetical protein
MANEPTDILVLERPVEPAEVARLLGLFGDMIKYAATRRTSGGPTTILVRVLTAVSSSPH